MSGTEMDEMVTTGGRVWIPKADHAREVEALLQERDAADAAVAKLEKLVEGQELMVISVEEDLAKMEADRNEWRQRAVDTRTDSHFECRQVLIDSCAKLERRISELEADTV